MPQYLRPLQNENQRCKIWLISQYRNIYIFHLFYIIISFYYKHCQREVKYINTQIIEEITDHFGRTGSNQRARLRKFHAEILLSKYLAGERVLNQKELNRPYEYIHRIVKFSKGFLEFIDEEACEIRITDAFFDRMDSWHKQYSDVEELDHSDENLLEQGIVMDEEGITFDGRLTYSRFYKVISDEGESMNNPEQWRFNDKNINLYNKINFADKDSAVFGSRLFLLKFYMLRKIDEVAFVTSRFVHCPACGANYVVPASKIDFMQTYKCEKIVGDKPCKTTLKKFPARKMIPTYIYEIGVEVQGKDGSEFKEYFLESFIELNPGYYTGMCFGRTEQKTNSFYFSCLTAKEETARHDFKLKEFPEHNHQFFNLVDSLVDHIQTVGFIIDRRKARLPVIVETLKKITLSINKEINMAHSLYFGAPGIGKSYALTMLHHLFYSNAGFISGPRFSLPGLTGGQKEIYYQDMAKKKNVPGLFSNQAFVFDEINNAQFLSDDKATNLFKSVALASSGTSSTVGGKEFPRVALIAGTANYDMNHLQHYENRIKKIYSAEGKTGVQEQTLFMSATGDPKVELPADFDFYAPLKSYGIDVPKNLKTAVLKVRDDGNNYLTDFPKPLMERFYYSVLVHPKYDKAFMKQQEIDVKGHLRSRKSEYGQRELMSQLFIPKLDQLIFENSQDVLKAFEDPEVERKWSRQVKEFLTLLSNKYVEFFSMFHRINQVHVFTLFALSVLNRETELSLETRRIYERVISLMHNPIEMKEFHAPDFENFLYYGETKATILDIIRRYPGRSLKEFVDFQRPYVAKNLVELENAHKIKKVDDFIYEIDSTKRFEEVE